MRVLQDPVLELIQGWRDAAQGHADAMDKAPNDPVNKSGVQTAHRSIAFSV
jgi:hypothetical protein